MVKDAWVVIDCGFLQHCKQVGNHLSCCSMYLKRFRCRHSTCGSCLIFMRFCASCKHWHTSQKNLSSASNVSVELHHTTDRLQCSCLHTDDIA